MRRLALTLAAACLVATPVAANAATDAQAARTGALWMARQQNMAPGQQADTIVSMAAVGASKASLRGRLRTLTPRAAGYAGNPGAAGKIVLAATAAGVNPRRLGGVNYVARIRAGYGDGRYGTTTYDQAYAILALRAAREPVPAAAITALRRTRGAGGWGHSLNPRVRDDVSATAITIEAARAAGVSPRDPMLVQATAWMVAQRNRSGGYAITGRGGPTEANSTALVVRALRAMGRRPAPATVRQLRALQERDGGFRFTRTIRESRVLATADASLALAGRTLAAPPR